MKIKQAYDEYVRRSMGSDIKSSEGGQSPKVEEPKIKRLESEIQEY